MFAGRLLALAVILFSAGAAWAAPDTDKESKGPLYVSLPPVSVPLVNGSYLSGSLFVRVDLAIETQATKARIERLLPRLEAAYLERLSLLSRSHIDTDRAVDLPLLGALLQRATDRVLEPGTARVLVQEAAVRR